MEATSFSQIEEIIRALISGGSLIIEFLGAATIAVAVARRLLTIDTLRLLFLHSNARLTAKMRSRPQKS
jgi:hypothetical protein